MHMWFLIAVLVSISAISCSPLLTRISALQGRYNITRPAVRELRTVLGQPVTTTAQSLYNNLYNKIINNPGNENIDIMLLMDSSRSLGQSNFLTGKQFLAEFIGALPRERFIDGTIRVSMLSYAEIEHITMEFDFNFTHYREPIRRAILQSTYQNGTYTHTALALCWGEHRLRTGGRSGARKLLLIVTDGKSDDDDYHPLGLTRSVNLLKNSSIEMSVVPLGENLDTTKISILAATPLSKHIFPVKNQQTKNQILSSLQSRLASSSDSSSDSSS